MGDPVDCIEDGCILNGDFYNEDFWDIGNFWSIHDFVAECAYPGAGADVNLFQYTNFVLNEFYVIDFDVLEANCPGNSGIRVRLGGAGGPSSGVAQTVGHKRTVLQYNGMGEWLLFYGWNVHLGPGNIIIDNVACAKMESFIACGMSFLKLPGTNLEWLDLGGGLYNVRYANPNGNTSAWFAWDINSF